MSYGNDYPKLPLGAFGGYIEPYIERSGYVAPSQRINLLSHGQTFRYGEIGLGPSPKPPEPNEPEPNEPEPNGPAHSDTEELDIPAEGPPTSDTEESKMTQPSPVLSVFQTLNADMAQAAKEGLTAGATAGAVSVLVDSVIRVFPDTPMLAMIAASRIGRAALNISVPYGVALVCDIYPALIPGNAAVVRGLCLSAAQGQFTMIAKPLFVVLAGPISQFVSTLIAHAPAAVAAAAMAPSADSASPATTAAPAAALSQG